MWYPITPWGCCSCRPNGNSHTSATVYPSFGAGGVKKKLGLSAVSPVSATRHQAISMEIARSLADNIQVNIQKRYNPIAQGVSQADRIELMRRRLAAFKAQLATVA